MRPRPAANVARRLRTLLILVVVPVALAPFMLFGFASVAAFEHELLPHYRDRAEVVATGVERRLEYGVQLFGDLAALRDVDATLDEALASSGEVAFIAVTDTNGTVVAQSPPGFAGLDAVLEARSGEGRAGIAEAIEHALDRAYRVVAGEPLFRAADSETRRAGDYLVTEVSIDRGDVPVGTVYLGTDVELLSRVRNDVAFDAVTLFLAALLIGVECLLLLFAINVTRPQALLRFLTDRLAANDLRFTVADPGGGRLGELVRQANAYIAAAAGRAAGSERARRDFSVPTEGRPTPLVRPAAGYIRLPLFLFFLAEALLRPSLPLFLGDLASPFGVGGEYQAGLAMAFFLIASILGVVAGSWLVERWALKPVLLMATLLAAAATLAHAAATDIVTASLLRTLAGLGYGVVYAAAQLYIVQHTETERRTSGFSFFLIIVVGAEVAGPAVGGVLADRLGADAAFVAATAALSLSVVIAALVLPGASPDLSAAKPREAGVPAPFRTVFATVARNGRFLALILCFSIPSKLLLTGGLFLLVPLAVAEAGYGATEAGRVIMAYGLVILVVAGPLARLADRHAAFGAAMAAGAMISGLGFVLPELMPGPAALYLGVALFGLGQALSIPTQMSFLLRLMQTEARTFGAGPVMGKFRFFERLGSALGPLAGAVLLTAADPARALLVLGAGAMVLAASGAAVFLTVGEQREEDAIDALLVRQ